MEPQAVFFNTLYNNDAIIRLFIGEENGGGEDNWYDSDQARNLIKERLLSFANIIYDALASIIPNVNLTILEQAKNNVLMTIKFQI